MRRRCFSPCDPSYRYVGGRGLTVCDRWRDSFAAFLADMGPRPAGHSIDRIDNDRGYSPDNCRWATASQQQINSRKAKFLEHDGKRLCLSDWSRLTGLSIGTITARMSCGWTVADALTISPDIGSRRRAARILGQGFPAGIRWNKNVNRWQARTWWDGRYHYLGYFADKADAGAAILAKLAQLQG